MRIRRALPLLAAACFSCAGFAAEGFAAAGVEQFDALTRGVVPMNFAMRFEAPEAMGGGTGGVPERRDVPEAMRWDLEAIYPSFEAWERAFSDLTPKIDALAGFAGHLGEGPKKLLEYLKAEEAVSLELEKLYVYANMKSHEDLRETCPMELASRIEALSARHGVATAFFAPEVMELPEEELRRWVREEPGLKLYAFFVEQLLREREHILPKAEEALLASAREATSAPENAFSLLTNADLKFPTIQDEEGQSVELTEERWYKLSRSPNRDVRRAAFEGIYGTYGSFRNALAALYAGSVKGDLFYARARRYKDSLEAALFGDNVPRSVYENVVDTAARCAPLMHRLVALRKRALKLDRLHYYDLNVPIAEEPREDIPYERACQMVAEALAPLGEDYVTNFKRGLAERWVDVYENRGKRKGAYSWGSYATHPYVLLNYNGTLNDVFTLAHEMGHSMHSWYSHRNQPQVYGDYTILLAEVASTTNEALLLGHLLKTAKTEEERKWLLSYYYNMVRTTFFRQAMFADFELQAHARAEEGGALTPEWMSGLWRELNERCYGPDMAPDELLWVEWARIPHFYSAFYVYKYVTGFTAANAFASAILAGEPGAVDRYLTFLKSGGSDESLNILRRAGVDLTSREPFDRTMKLFQERLEEGERVWGR